MKTKNEEFEVLVPNIDGTAVAERVKVTIPLRWDEELEEWLLTPEAHQIIEDTKARHMGLLLPAQLKELRERYDYTQKEMGELFQVGEKSWTRWESGKHRPSRSINLIIRALYEGEISINYLLNRAGKPNMVKPETSAKTFETGLATWLTAMLEGCHPSAGLIFPEEIMTKPVIVQTKTTVGKNDFLNQILKMTFELGQAGLPGDSGIALPPQRFTRTAPTHVYKQPRLANIPTEA
jgi:transcriptional regulator with XRE-family HTH domain